MNKIDMRRFIKSGRKAILGNILYIMMKNVETCLTGFTQQMDIAFSIYLSVVKLQKYKWLKFNNQFEGNSLRLIYLKVTLVKVSKLIKIKK